MDSPYPENLSPTRFITGSEESSFLEHNHDADVLKCGTTIANRYSVVSLIGRGGMGAVYKVKHLSLGKMLAMKVLWSDYATHPIHSIRFTVEAKAASTLDHPNLVAVRDFGVKEFVAPFLVMDYIEGESLTEVIQRHQFLDWVTVVDYALQIADGLAYAHAQGIVHRDLKPTNILVASAACGSTLIKVVDFGIAKISRPTAELQSVTRTGEIFGSPLYMSPEQCAGQVADHRSDIYSLGCVMYESLVGRPPFTGDNSVSTMFKHMTELPQRPSDLTKNSIPVQLQRLVLRCLEKDPGSRFQSMEELKTALTKIKELRKPAISLTLPAVIAPKPLKPVNPANPAAVQISGPLKSALTLTLPSPLKCIAYALAFMFSVLLGVLIAVATGISDRFADTVSSHAKAHVSNHPLHRKAASHKIV